MLFFKTCLYTWKNIRQHYTNSKLKIIAPTGNDEFELPDGSSDIPGYIKYIKKQTNTHLSPYLYLHQQD